MPYGRTARTVRPDPRAPAGHRCGHDCRPARRSGSRPGSVAWSSGTPRCAGSPAVAGSTSPSPLMSSLRWAVYPDAGRVCAGSLRRPGCSRPARRLPPPSTWVAMSGPRMSRRAGTSRASPARTSGEDLDCSVSQRVFGAHGDQPWGVDANNPIDGGSEPTAFRAATSANKAPATTRPRGAESPSGPTPDPGL
jgi:hypothetical protein